MSDKDDKTVIKVGDGPVEAPAGADDTVVAEDKTRFTPPKVKKTDSAVAADKTRIKSSASPGVMSSGDKTRFTKPSTAPGRQRDDRTRVQPSRSGRPAADAAQGSVSGVVPQTEAEADAQNYGVLKGRFVFEEVLGSGGMGIVYKAKDLLKVEAQDRDPYVAIKVLSDEFKAHPEAFIALQRESRKTQRMAHPNIVNVHDFDRDGDTVFMTMEYMDGTPLDKLISQYRSVGLPNEMIWQILEGISAALIYAHAQNVIHSDFKPGNIFVNKDGSAKVFDFGIARAVAKAENREESKDDRTVFDAGNLGALTPAYASLEMLEGQTPDIRDDVYALGCIAYEVFTGEHPYNRMHADEAKRQKAKLKRIPGITKGQWRAIEHALAFERENRTESVEQFWREFTRKDKQTGKLILAMLLMSGLAGYLYYEYKPADQPQFTEDQFRSEIEMKLRIEMKKESLAELYALAEFIPAWEQQLWIDVQELRRLLGARDPWLVEQESAFYALYLNAIEKNLADGQLSKAQSLAQNARRYTSDLTRIETLEGQIAQAAAEAKRRAQEEEARRQAQIQQRAQAVEEAEVVAQQRTEFDSALANVDKQLQCYSTIDMRDFEIAISKLRSIDSQRYAAEEPKITRALALCIERIGSTFPERGEDAKRAAMLLFQRNATIAGINIVAKDPCGPSLAGGGARGRRGTCTDSGDGLNQAPTLVVIPGATGIKTFAIGQFEVSVGEMNAFCKASASCPTNDAVDRDLPAHNVSLATARNYLNWLSEKSGRRYRLPTLTEWQHAARADGSRIDSNRNCRLNSRGISKGNALVKATIGQKNSWGLVNHLGNAREWVMERGGRYLAVGGSFETPMNECSLEHVAEHNGEADAITGFRVLREVDG